MTITIGTILLLCGIVGVFLRNYNSYRRLYLSLYTLMILIKLSINVGFFVSIGGYEILYDEVLTILIAVLALIGLLYYKVNLQIFYCLILFVSIILVSLILNIAGIYNVYGIPYGQSWDNYFYGKTLFQQLNVTATSFLMFARLIMFAISFIMFCKLIDFNYFKRLFKIVYRVSLFLAVIYILEFILKNIFHSAFLNNLYLDIFGHSLSTKDELGANVMGIYATIGLYREQSALATNFGLIALILLFGYKFTAKKKYLAMSIILIIFSCLSMAFTAVLFLILYAVFAIRLLVKRRLRIVCWICLVLVSVVTILLIMSSDNTYGERIRNALYLIFNFDGNGSYEITSENIRIYSMMYNLGLFIKYPLFGLGMGVSYSHSGTVSVLVSIGLLGVISYLFLLNSIFKNTIKINPNWGCILIFAICNIFVGGINFIYSESYVIIYLLSTLHIKKERCRSGLSDFKFPYYIIKNNNIT